MPTDPIMEPADTHPGQLLEASKRLARLLLTLGEKRFALLVVKVADARKRSMQGMLPARGAAVGVLRVGRSLADAILVLMGRFWRGGALLVLSSPYGATADCLCRGVTLQQRGWQ
jgi:hypothetical protein